MLMLLTNCIQFSFKNYILHINFNFTYFANFNIKKCKNFRNVFLKNKKWLLNLILRLNNSFNFKLFWFFLKFWIAACLFTYCHLSAARFYLNCCALKGKFAAALYCEENRSKVPFDSKENELLCMKGPINQFRIQENSAIMQKSMNEK